MEDLIQILTDGLLKLREDLDNLPSYEEDIKKINELIATIQANQLKEADIKNLVVLLATGYFATQKEDYTKLMNDLSTKLNDDNQTLIKSEVDNLSNQADLLINKAIATIKQDLTAFKATIKNGRDGLDGLDGRNGKDGINGVDGKDGKDGLNGKNGLDGKDGANIQDIIYKSNNLIITLTDGTTKTIKFNIPTQFIGGGGGVHEDRVIQLINDAIGGSIDAYTKEETQTSLPKIGFDTTNTTTPSIGQMAWNQDESTVDLGLDGATLQIGQEMLVKVRNDDITPILNGQVVMATGSLGNSGRILVKPHTGLRSNAKQILGIATEDIAVGSDGLVTTFGKVRNINTTGSTVGETWNDGDNLYLKPNDNGNLTKIVPLNTEVNMPIAVVVHSHTNGTLFVRISGVDENLYNDAQNLFIQDTVPTLATGKQALWIDTTNGDIQFNLVIGD